MNCTHETTEFRRQRYRGYGCDKDWQKVNQCLICLAGKESRIPTKIHFILKILTMR